MLNGADTRLYDRAVSIYEQLVRQGRSDLASELNRARANKAIAIRELGEQRAAAALADQTIALYERLVEQEGRQDLAEELSTLYEGRATTLLELGDADRARSYQRLADTLQEQAASTVRPHNLIIEEEEDLSIRLCDVSTIVPGDTTPPTTAKPLVIDETTNPFAIIAHLLVQAKAGEESLAVLRGCEFVRELGRGGMGAVALVQRSPGSEAPELLALKVMLPQLAVKEKAEKRFQREIEIGMALVHPHILPLRDWGRWRNVYFFTSDYCDSGDVEQLTRQHGGKLPPQEARPIILQTLDALEHAHAHGVVHRDVKPSNIFLSRSGAGPISKLGDFGVAKAFATTGLTGPGDIGGSPQFMPQQLLDDFKMATPEVDVWSAAASLYYMLTGQPPRDFSNEPPTRWLWVVSNRPPVPIRQREATISPALADVIDHALDDRDSLAFASAAALRHAVESVL